MTDWDQFRLGRLSPSATAAIRACVFVAAYLLYVYLVDPPVVDGWAPLAAHAGDLLWYALAAFVSVRAFGMGVETVVAILGRQSVASAVVGHGPVVWESRRSFPQVLVCAWPLDLRIRWIATADSVKALARVPGYLAIITLGVVFLVRSRLVPADGSDLFGAAMVSYFVSSWLRSPDTMPHLFSWLVPLLTPMSRVEFARHRALIDAAGASDVAAMRRMLREPGSVALPPTTVQVHVAAADAYDRGYSQAAATLTPLVAANPRNLFVLTSYCEYILGAAEAGTPPTPAQLTWLRYVVPLLRDRGERRVVALFVGELALFDNNPTAAITWAQRGVSWTPYKQDKAFGCATIAVASARLGWRKQSEQYLARAERLDPRHPRLPAVRRRIAEAAAIASTPTPAPAHGAATV